MILQSILFGILIVINGAVGIYEDAPGRVYNLINLYTYKYNPIIEHIVIF